jgi:hypothetical protein
MELVIATTLVLLGSPSAKARLGVSVGRFAPGLAKGGAEVLILRKIYGSCGLY